jgi:PKD repeat protein
MVRFAPDGKLLLGVGDGSDGDVNSLRAQDLHEFEGKILRLNADGTAPTDNPFYDGTNSVASKVFVRGVRTHIGSPSVRLLENSTSEMSVGILGGTKSRTRRCQLWLAVLRGKRPLNPFFKASLRVNNSLPASVTLPLLAYPRSEGSAVIGGAFYTATNYPEVYRGSYFFADYVGDWIRRVVFDANGNPTSISTFATEVGSPVTLELGPDGNLYYISFTTGQIRRIRFNGPNAVATASPSSGYSPLQVFFSSQGSSAPGGGQLTYLWDFGDGSTSAQANPVHTYATGGVTTFVATLTVTTTTNAKASSTVKVTVGSLPPVPTIALPADGTVFLPGQIVTYQGSANDPDQGALPPSALHWDVLLHHNTHIHVSTTNTGSAQGSFVVEDHGIGSYAYEIILTATDASGLTGSTSVLLPVAADTTPPTPPTGLIATAVNANQVSLSWTASTDNVAVLSYRVERCQGAGCSNFAEIGPQPQTPTILIWGWWRRRVTATVYARMTLAEISVRIRMWRPLLRGLASSGHHTTDRPEWIERHPVKQQPNQSKLDCRHRQCWRHWVPCRALCRDRLQ